MVGGLLLSVQEGWVDEKDNENKRGFLPFLLFNASRIITFAILGGLLGALGGIIQLSFKASAVSHNIDFIIDVYHWNANAGCQNISKDTFEFLRPSCKLCYGENKIKNRLMPIIFGAITFFVPCGFTLIAQAQALESGSFFRGLSVLTAFALGTLPVLLLISFSSLKFHKDPKFSNSFRLLSGLLIVFFAMFTLNSQLGILQLPSLGNVKAQTADVPLTAPEINSQIAPSENQIYSTFKSGDADGSERF